MNEYYKDVSSTVLSILKSYLWALCSCSYSIACLLEVHFILKSYKWRKKNESRGSSIRTKCLFILTAAKVWSFPTTQLSSRCPFDAVIHHVEPFLIKIQLKIAVLDRLDCCLGFVLDCVLVPSGYTNWKH